MNADKIAAELRKGLEGVTPGEWESDSIRNEGFDAYQVIAPPLYPGGRDVVVCDTLNSDATSVAEEWDEDGCHSAWDEQGRKNMAHLARCSKPNILALLDAYDERGRLLADALEGLREALAYVEYQPGDHPVVPYKYAKFHDRIRSLLSKLKEATDDR